MTGKVYMTTKTLVIRVSNHLFKSAVSYLGGATLIITVAAHLRDLMLSDRRTFAGGDYS